MSWHSDDVARGDGVRHEIWHDDDALADALAEAVAETELHTSVTAAGHRAFATHRVLLAARAELDADLLLLELVHDSLVDGSLGAVRDRSGTPSRTLIFEGDGLGVELEVTDGGVEGQLIPARPGRVTLRDANDEIASTATDEVGYFRIETRPTGPVRLTCSSESGTCATPWLPW